MNKKIHSFSMKKIVPFILAFFGGFHITFGAAIPDSPPLPAGTSCAVGTGIIGGTVFADFNENGIQDANETTGLAGIRVQAFDDAGVVVDFITTNDIGEYALNVGADGTTFRIEFDMIPAGMFPTFSGTNNGTTVQFAAAPTCAVDLGLNDPANFASADPPIAVTCYVAGDPLVAGTPNMDATVDTVVAGELDVIVSLNWSETGQSPIYSPDVMGADAGSLWGLAFNAITQELFSAAFVKRLAGMGPLGPGGIYVTDYNGPPTTSGFLDLNTIPGIDAGSTVPSNAARGLTYNAMDNTTEDAVVFNLVFKEGLGDIDFSSDYNTLYITNLTERNIIAIDMTAYNTSGTIPGAAQMTEIPLPATTCNLGVARPFALKYDFGKLWAGITCTGEMAGSALTDVFAYVYSYDGTTWVQELLVPMSYNRNVGAFNPWTDDLTTIYAGQEYPQPVLSDIEFNADNFMVLGFSDRTSHQTGDAYTFPDGTAGKIIFTKGEILMAGYDGTNYVLESNAIVNGVMGFQQWSNNGPGTLNATGDGYTGAYGHFFDDQIFEGNSVMGGLALRKDVNETVATVSDPFAIQSGGITYFDNTNGADLRRVELYEGAPPLGPGFGKAAGLGDIELMPVLAPLQIGNFVWADTDQDGVQDPSESGLDGVIIELYDAAGNLIAITTTANGGQYYFSGDGDGGGQVWATAGDKLGFNTTYYVVAGGGGQFSGGSITVNTTTYTGVAPQFTGAGSSATSNDTDAAIAGGTEPAAISGMPFVAVTTGTAGATDHTFDVGFVEGVVACGADNGTTTLIKQ